MNTIRIVVFSVCFSALMGTNYANAAVFYVRQGAGGSGISWQDAAGDLQAAINAASEAYGTSGQQQEVWVAAGTYRPTGHPNGGTELHQRHFALRNGVSLYGGFIGTESTRNQRDVAANGTVLSGDLNGDDIPVAPGHVDFPAQNMNDNVNHIFFLWYNPPLDSTPLLDGFTVSGGYARYTNPEDLYNEDGGAMLICGTEITLSNCIFERNKAQMRGGAIAVWDGMTTLKNCTFRNNRSLDWGGALQDTGFVTAKNCTFTGNQAEGGAGAYIWESEYNNTQLPRSIYTDCTFTSNRVDGSGGACFIMRADPLFTRCNFTDNTAADRGGAVHGEDESSPVTFQDCLFENNTADFGGGIEFDSPFKINDGLFRNNLAHGGGGAIRTVRALVGEIQDCQFIHNRGGYGGALQFDNFSGTIVRSQFTENRAGPGSVTVKSDGSTLWTIRDPGSYHGNPWGSGGAVAGDDSSLQIDGCSFMRNSASCDATNAANGGALNLNRGSARIANCTFYKNASPDTGGGIYGSGFVTMQHCTLFGNASFRSSISVSSVAGATNCIFWGGALVADKSRVEYSIIRTSETNGWGSGCLFQNPQLLAIANNGGSTYTCALLPSSPAIDAGRSYSGVPSIDQRGFTRDSSPDMGAYEFAHEPLQLVPDPFAFGMVPVGKRGTMSLNIINWGIVSVNVTGISSPAGFTGTWAGSLLPGGQSAVPITFFPTEYERYSGIIEVLCDSSAGNPKTTISGEGTTERKNDFDGDGKSDIGCYAPDLGAWAVFLSKSSALWSTNYAGGVNTHPITGYFDDDNLCDYGTYSAPAGLWRIHLSAGDDRETHFGFDGTSPITGDFDGDGITDFGCYYPPDGGWFIFKSKSSSLWTTHFGFSGTLPVTDDFDGDGIDDFGCYYPPNGGWFIFMSASKSLWTTHFGFGGTLPITGDFDGDKKGDFGCYYPPDGTWFIFKSASKSLWTTRFGFSGTTPVVGDYDGDGLDDFGCYYPPTGGWFIFKSTTGLWTTRFGYEGTIAIQ